MCWWYVHTLFIASFLHLFISLSLSLSVCVFAGLHFLRLQEGDTGDFGAPDHECHARRGRNVLPGQVHWLHRALRARHGGASLRPGVCVCVCVSVCVCVCGVCLCVYAYVYVCMCMCVCMHVYV